MPDDELSQRRERNKQLDEALNDVKRAAQKAAEEEINKRGGVENMLQDVKDKAKGKK